MFLECWVQSTLSGRLISLLKLYLYIVSVIVMFGVMFRLCVGAFGLAPNALFFKSSWDFAY